MTACPDNQSHSIQKVPSDICQPLGCCRVGISSSPSGAACGWGAGRAEEPKKSRTAQARFRRAQESCGTSHRSLASTALLSELPRSITIYIFFLETCLWLSSSRSP